MATLLADVATKSQAGGLSNAVLNGLIDARLKAMLDSLTIDGATEVVASTIDIGGTLPSGARVVGILIYVSANQSSATLSIGDDASATRYANAATDIQAAGTYLYSGKNYKTGQTTGDRQIVLTTGGATLTAGQLEAVVVYTMD